MAKGSKVTKITTKMKPDFDGFISKIRIDAKTDIPDICYNERNEKNDKTVILKGQAKPLDDFLKAMQDLAAVFCEICEIKDKEDDVLITTVNFSEKGGIIISGQVPLNNGVPQPLCINTPHIMLEAEKGYSIPDYALEKIEELKRQAVLYIRGEAKEKQQELFDQEAIG